MPESVDLDVEDATENVDAFHCDDVAANQQGMPFADDTNLFGDPDDSSGVPGWDLCGVSQSASLDNSF